MAPATPSSGHTRTRTRRCCMLMRRPISPTSSTTARRRRMDAITSVRGTNSSPPSWPTARSSSARPTAWRYSAPSSERSLIAGADLEVVGFAPGILTFGVRIEAHHGAGEQSVLQVESQVVEIHRGLKMRELAAEEARIRHGLRAAPAAHEVGDPLAEVALVVVHVAADDHHPLGKQGGVLREPAGDLPFVLAARKQRIPDRWIVQYHQDELQLRVCRSHLVLEPLKLLTLRLERGARVEHHGEHARAERHRVPAEGFELQRLRRLPPILEARSRLTAIAAAVLVVAEHRKHGDVLLRPGGRLAPVDRVVIRVVAVVYQIAADQDRGRMLRGD